MPDRVIQANRPLVIRANRPVQRRVDWSNPRPQTHYAEAIGPGCTARTAGAVPDIPRGRAHPAFDQPLLANSGMSKLKTPPAGEVLTQCRPGSIRSTASFNAAKAG